MLPDGRLRSVLHHLGEAENGLLLTWLGLALPLDILRLLFPAWPWGVLGFGVLALYLLLLFLGYRHAFRLQIHAYPILLNKPCPQLRVLLLSDLHLGLFSDRGMTQRIAEKAADCAPDLILIAGDLFDGRFAELRHPEEAQAGLQALAHLAPCFACPGNHDLLYPEPARLLWLEQAGICVLSDEGLSFRGLSLFFRQDLQAGERLPAAALPEKLGEGPALVVDHNPAEYRQLWAAGADLVLSGHTHGGQSFPGNLFYRLLPIFAYGHRQENGRHAVVSSGVGIYGLPLRLGVDNELVLLELSGAEKC
jgi:predicted MPP superfamily phosphohydrolase